MEDTLAMETEVQVQSTEHRTQGVPETGEGLYYNFKGAQGKEDSWVSDWYNSSLQLSSGGHLTHNSSFGGHLLGSGGGHLYQAIIQGVLVCLFTTVGGVMLLVFCLIIVQECKLMYVWAVRRRNEEVAPPSYHEVSKPPSYSSCHPRNRGVRSQSQESVTETEPPAYSDLYSRDNSQLDRLVICDGVGTLIHSATISDVNLDILDWNLQHQHQQQRINSTSGSVVVSQDEQTGPPEPETGREERSSVQASRSMFTIITTPRRKETKNKFCSLEMFKLSSKDGSSSGEEDSVPLLDDVNVV